MSSKTGARASAEAQRLVRAFFNDAEKTKLWFDTPNPLLGHVRPNDLVRMGRADKVLQFVERALGENRAPPGEKERAR